MDLLGIREQLAELSGYQHLINENGSDAGADFFINEACKWLDEAIDNPKSILRYHAEITENTYTLEMADLMAVYQVWLMGTNIAGQTKRIQLEERTLLWLRDTYNEPPGSITTDSPLYYAVNTIGLAPALSAYTDTDTDGWYDIGDLKYADHWNTHGIIFMPPADKTYYMTVFGSFHSKNLTSDSHKNYWTVCKPFTLIKAACMLIEDSLRNTQGSKDWESAVMRDLRGIDKMTAEMDWAPYHDITELEG